MSRFPLLPQPLRWVLARQAKRFDRGLRRWIARTPDLAHMTLEIAGPEQMAEDGFHPNAIIYALWADVAVEAMESDPRVLPDA